MSKVSDLLSPNTAEVVQLLDIIERFARGDVLIIGYCEVWHDTRDRMPGDHPDTSTDMWVVARSDRDGERAYFSTFLLAVEYAEWKAD